jgi:hypothetical protein
MVQRKKKLKKRPKNDNKITKGRSKMVKFWCFLHSSNTGANEINCLFNEEDSETRQTWNTRDVTCGTFLYNLITDYDTADNLTSRFTIWLTP